MLTDGDRTIFPWLLPSCGFYKSLIDFSATPWNRDLRHGAQHHPGAWAGRPISGKNNETWSSRNRKNKEQEEQSRDVGKSEVEIWLYCSCARFTMGRCSSIAVALFQSSYHKLVCYCNFYRGLSSSSSALSLRFQGVTSTPKGEL